MPDRAPDERLSETSPSRRRPSPAALFALARTNRNYRTLRRVVGPVVRNDEGGTLVWLQKEGADGVTTMMWQPETPLEKADAGEFYELANWRSWKNQKELRELLRGPGPWVVRLNLSEIYSLLSADAAARLLDGPSIPRKWHEADDAFTGKRGEAARLTSQQAMRLIPQLMKTYPHHGVAYFEPVKPEYALRDVRMLRLKPGGWLPRVHNSYSPEDLARFFGVARLPPLSRRHPFVRVPDAFLCLLDPGRGYAAASFEFPVRSRFVWKSGCAGAGSRRHNPSCGCFPEEMLRSRRMQLCHVFVRSEPDAAGDGGQPEPDRHTYLGLGHLDQGVGSGDAYFRLEPDLPPRLFRALRQPGEAGRQGPAGKARPLDGRRRGR